MKSDAIAFGIAGIAFGLIAGWIIGTQQAGPTRHITQVAQKTPAASAPAQGQGQQSQAAVLDEEKARTLISAAESRPNDEAVRVELGNMYFDAERYADAIKWYEQALTINPKDPNVSTDLGVSYYYSNQPDRALAQFEKSLAVDPKHTKTLLNQGIVRAFGKQDLESAAKSWEQVIALAPDSPEGRAAKQALDSMKSAHPGGQTPPGTGASANPGSGKPNR
jgi:tetratricopeptide (TPR) repeat protein